MGLTLAITENNRHVGLCDAKEFGYFGLRHGAFQASDLSNLFRGEQLLEEGDETGIDGMLLVAPVVSPFEVGRRAIRFDSVNVIDHGEMVRVGDEGKCNEAMQQERFDEPCAIQAPLLIPKFVDARPENFAIASLRATEPHSHSVNTSHATEGAYFVRAFEAYDRDRSPFFGDDGIHVAGGPSDYIGSTIKNPSRAATFGGFAMMASATGIYNGRI